MMRRISIPALSLCACVAVLSGCVPYQTYDDLKTEYGRAEKINRDLTAKLNQLVQEYNRLRGGEEFTGATVESLRERLASLQQTNTDLKRRIDELDQLRLETPGGVGFEDIDAAGIPGATIDPRTRALVLEEGILFNSGEASLKSKKNPTLDRVASLLKGQYAGETFHIVGHTDNEPLHRTADRWKTNLRLGFERAYTVFDYLTQVHGIDKNQFVVHSFGELKPTSPDSNRTKEGRARNRRVEIYRAGARI